jgi:zinc transport system substrate-binding protein
MKYIKKIFLVGIILFLTCGCSLVKDSLEDATIYTTVYPIKYLTKSLYKDYGTVESIYPNGADINSYTLTSKQIDNYSKGSLFIYNGLENEINIAQDLINKNKNLLIIDVASGLSYSNDVKELWLSPNNYLMLAKNIKDNLTEYLQNKVIIDYVKEQYNELAEDLSLKDADLRSIGTKAKEKGTNTIIVNDNAFNFLKNYGFNVISLDESTITETTYNNLKSSFSKGTYKKILVLDKNYNDYINNLIKDAKAEAVEVSSLTILDTDQDVDYLNNLQEIIDSIRNICLSD